MKRRDDNTWKHRVYLEESSTPHRQVPLLPQASVEVNSGALTRSLESRGEG